MKRRFYIFGFVAVVLTMVMTGCNKKDCNGDLDGMWQLTEWRDKDNVVKATKQDMIFYSFQLQMACFRKQTGDNFNLQNTSLKVSPGQIYIYNPIVYSNGHDNVQPMSVLSPFGVPEDGIFLIQVLTSSTMQLRTNGQDVLTFRKY